MQHETYRIGGMTCAACALRIEKGLARMAGVQEVAVNLAMARLHISYDAAQTTGEDIVDKVTRLGFQVETEQTADPVQAGERERRSLRNRFLWSALLTLPLMWTMFRHYSFTSGVWVPDLLMDPWFQFALAAPVQFGFGYPFYAGAYRALRSRTANMDVLVALSTTLAFFYSHYLTVTVWGRQWMHGGAHAHSGEHVHLYYETSAMIITVVLMGKWFESLARRRTLQAIHRLHAMRSTEVTVIERNNQRRVAVEDVQAGDVLLIHPGEQIPVDGTVAHGESDVDESAWNGEAAWMTKRTGDTVTSGTVNKTGALHIRVTRIGQQSTAAKMAQLLEEAQRSKPSIQRVADRIAQYFVPALVVLGAVTFLWMLYREPGQVGQALERAIAVLVIACPCAIGLATPTSILVGTGRAAQLGILFKEGRHLEQLQRVDTVLFDKTGTVTEGRPVLTDTISYAGEASSWMPLVAGAEQQSEHPLGQAVVAAARQQQLPVSQASSFRAVPGYGVEAVVEGKPVIVGTQLLLQQHGIAVKMEKEEASRMEAEQKTLLYAAVAGRCVGVLALRDALSATSRDAVRRLQRAGVQVAMLTGDNFSTAQAVAQQLGIDDVHAQMTPEGKVAHVRQLQAAGRTVAVVGDGMNDAAALAAADVGIAVGSGSSMTVDAADVTLLRRNLTGVAHAIRLSRKTMGNIRQNMTFAVGYNVLAIPFAMAGILEPWMAGTAMTLSSVSVVLNALRLQNK